MRHFVAGLPLAILFIANIFPSLAQSAGAAAGVADEVLEVAAGAPLRLRCQLRPEERLQWARDGGPLPAGLRAAAEAPAGALLAAELSAPAAAPHHAGRYTCAAGGKATRLVVLPAHAGSEAAPATVQIQYEVRGNLSLRCPLTVDAATTIEWSKNGTALADVPILKNRMRVEGGLFKIEGRAVEEDYGEYECRAGGAVAGITVRGRTHAKLPPDTNVVEGQKLKLSCRLVGKPYDKVSWLFTNDTYPNGTDVRAALGAERVVLKPSEQGVEDADLVVMVAERSDAGVYTCTPSSPTGAASATTLRVKDMYAALWPFLGIVAEVAALCAVILVYERRRGKPEPEDSDADHDQKKS